MEVESPEDEKKCKRNSFMHKAISASKRFKTSFIKKGRKNSRVMYVVVEDVHDAVEINHDEYQKNSRRFTLSFDIRRIITFKS